MVTSTEVSPLEVRTIGAGKAPLGSILGPFTCEVVKVCSFLDGSAGSA